MRKKKPTLNENKMAARIREREDNPIYRHKMIKEILHMYSDKIRKAVLNGERVQITGVGTIIPEVKVHKGSYNMPLCNKTEGNPPPYGRLKISDNRKLSEVMNRKIRQNIKNGIYGLKNLLFTKPDFEFLKETGYIPEDAELPEEE